MVTRYFGAPFRSVEEIMGIRTFPTTKKQNVNDGNRFARVTFHLFDVCSSAGVHCSVFYHSFAWAMHGWGAGYQKYISVLTNSNWMAGLQRKCCGNRVAFGAVLQGSVFDKQCKKHTLVEPHGHTHPPTNSMSGVF